MVKRPAICGPPSADGALSSRVASSSPVRDSGRGGGRRRRFFASCCRYSGSRRAATLLLGAQASAIRILVETGTRWAARAGHGLAGSRP